MDFVGEQNLYITLCDAILLIITIYYMVFAPAKVEFGDNRHITNEPIHRTLVPRAGDFFDS